MHSVPSNSCQISSFHEDVDGVEFHVVADHSLHACRIGGCLDERLNDHLDLGSLEHCVVVVIDQQHVDKGVLGDLKLATGMVQVEFLDAGVDITHSLGTLVREAGPFHGFEGRNGGEVTEKLVGVSADGVLLGELLEDCALVNAREDSAHCLGVWRLAEGSPSELV